MIGTSCRREGSQRAIDICGVRGKYRYCWCWCYCHVGGTESCALFSADDEDDDDDIVAVVEVEALPSRLGLLS